MSSLLDSNNDARSNSRLATQLYWLTGLAPIVTNVVTPLMVFLDLRYFKKEAPLLIEQYNQQVQELSRQFISGTIGIVSYFGGGEITRGVLNLLNIFGFKYGPNKTSGNPVDDSRQKVTMLLGGMAMSFIGFAIVRPLLSIRLIFQFKKAEGVKAALTGKELNAIHAQANTKEEIQRLTHEKLAKVVNKEIGANRQGGFIMRKIQGWVDRNLFENGVPKLGKTVGVSTLALTAWLTALAGGFYALSKALGSIKQAPAKLPTSHPLASSPTGLQGYSPAPLAAPMSLTTPRVQIPANGRYIPYAYTQAQSQPYSFRIGAP